MGMDIVLIWPSGKAKYFLFWGLTRFPKNRIDLPVGQNPDGRSGKFASVRVPRAKRD
jgi:hypothetical protein